MPKNIKIFVSCHKPSIVLKNNLIYPIQVGTALAKTKMPNMLHDNEGDNISTKNKMYCELTAQYYAWKNIEADYYGFFHYRRYFSFANKKFRENFDGVSCQKLNQQVIEKFGLTEENMRSLIEQYDVIAPTKAIVVNMHMQYCSATTQSKTDLDFCLNYICEHYPQMKKVVKQVSHCSKNYICNMFIMKKDIFHEYCEWLFDILSAHEKAMQLDHYDVQSYRVSGYLAERLCGIYLHWLKSKKDIKFKELQRIMFKQTDDSDLIKFENDVCPILINANSKTFLQSGVLANSIVKNANNQHSYAILVNDCGMKEYQLNYFKRLSLPSNIKLRVIKNKNLKNANKYKQIAETLPYLSKLILLDSSCVVNGDIYNLFEYGLSAEVGGVYDLQKIIKFGKTRLKNQAKKLSVERPYQKISSSVLVFDLQKLRESKQFATQVIDQKWCVEINEKQKVDEMLYAFAPHYIYNGYMESKKKPFIVAFKGKYIPQNNSLVENGYIYWQSAMESAIFEECLCKMIRHHKKIKKSVYDAILPKGTTMRLFVKTYIKKY